MFKISVCAVAAWLPSQGLTLAPPRPGLAPLRQKLPKAEAQPPISPGEGAGSAAVLLADSGSEEPGGKGPLLASSFSAGLFQ